MQDGSRFQDTDESAFYEYISKRAGIGVQYCATAHVGLTLAHQHMHQLEPDIRHAVLSNAGTLISFRVGPEDAGVLAREFQPKFEIEDIINLPNP